MKFKFYAVKTSVVCFFLFALQIFIPGFTEFFLLNEKAISNFEIWRFVSSIFLHGGFAHLFLNLFALLLFGSILEKLIGEKRFLLIFFSTGILANLISINFYNSSLGASGAIFGVIGTLIIIRPTMPVWAFGLPMPIFVAGILWAALDLMGAIGFIMGNPIDNTGNIAHLSGMFFGFIFGFIYRNLFRKQIVRKNVSIDENEIRNWEDNYLR